MIDWQKRYYAHKRLCKAICGHKSCKKQDCPSVDIFDTKMDSNFLEKNINKIFQSVVVYIAQMPVSDFSWVRNWSQTFFISLQLDKKDIRGIRTQLAIKFFDQFLYIVHTPVNDFSSARDHSQAFFYFPHNLKITEAILLIYKMKSQPLFDDWLSVYISTELLLWFLK